MAEAVVVIAQSYQHWCQLHGCDHAHCPYDCDHPQPFTLDDGRLVCGRCAILDHELVEMIACTPETCGDEHNA